MIIKDNETGEFWCPMSRVHNPAMAVSGYNTVADVDCKGVFEAELVDSEVSYCRGPRCMMWRYLTYGKEICHEGYCGLAGVPNLKV